MHRHTRSCRFRIGDHLRVDLVHCSIIGHAGEVNIDLVRFNTLLHSDIGLTPRCQECLNASHLQKVLQTASCFLQGCLQVEDSLSLQVRVSHIHWQTPWSYRPIRYTTLCHLVFDKVHTYVSTDVDRVPILDTLREQGWFDACCGSYDFFGRHLAVDGWWDQSIQNLTWILRNPFSRLRFGSTYIENIQTCTLLLTPWWSLMHTPCQAVE